MCIEGRVCIYNLLTEHAWFERKLYSLVYIQYQAIMILLKYQSNAGKTISTESDCILLSTLWTYEESAGTRQASNMFIYYFIYAFCYGFFFAN